MQRSGGRKEEYKHFLSAIREEFAGVLIVEKSWVEVEDLLQELLILDRNDSQALLQHAKKIDLLRKADK